jgi:hypothetical protein
MVHAILEHMKAASSVWFPRHDELARHVIVQQ